MIDLTSKRMLSDRLNSYIDSALEDERDKEPKRGYLGGSRIGAGCERALQFEFFNTPKDPGKDFSGRILRVFERGHWVESAVVRWLRVAGVTIITEDEDGEQFGFSDFDGYYQGHCDGVIVAGPDAFGPVPMLWENKGLKQEGWNPLVKNGLRKEKPIYWAQCQVYMNRFGLTKNPALFSAVNMNTMEIYWEAVPYNPGALAQLDAKTVRILQSCMAGEILPRLSHDLNFYQCKWCSWRNRCHGLGI